MVNTGEIQKQVAQPEQVVADKKSGWREVLAQKASALFGSGNKEGAQSVVEAHQQVVAAEAQVVAANAALQEAEEMAHQTLEAVTSPDAAVGTFRSVTVSEDDNLREVTRTREAQIDKPEFAIATMQNTADSLRLTLAAAKNSYDQSLRTQEGDTYGETPHDFSFYEKLERDFVKNAKAETLKIRAVVSALSGEITRIDRTTNPAEKQTLQMAFMKKIAPLLGGSFYETNGGLIQIDSGRVTAEANDKQTEGLLGLLKNKIPSEMGVVKSLDEGAVSVFRFEAQALDLRMDARSGIISLELQLQFFDLQKIISQGEAIPANPDMEADSVTRLMGEMQKTLGKEYLHGEMRYVINNLDKLKRIVDQTDETSPQYEYFKGLMLEHSQKIIDQLEKDIELFRQSPGSEASINVYQQKIDFFKKFI